MAVPYRKGERVRETTSTTGSGLVINLDGATLQCRSFVGGLLTPYGEGSAGHQVDCPYALLSGDGVSWERGTCRVTSGSPNTLSRDTIKFTTAGGTTRISLVGVSKVFVFDPALEGFFTDLTVRATGGAAIAIENFANVPSFASMEVRGAGGTEAAPTYPVLDQVIGGYVFLGWDEGTASWKSAGQILVAAAENWTATSRATRMTMEINPSGSAADMWSASYNAHFTLTGSGTIATTNVGSLTDTIIGQTSRTSGKFYFELLAGPSSDEFYWGLAEASHVNSVGIGSLSPSGGGGTTKSVAFGSYSTIFHSWFVGGVATASGMSTGPSGEWLGFAVDLDTGYILVRKTSAPTVWYGNNSNLGDPASIATHGFPFTPFGAALFLAFTSNQNASGAGTTMNGGGSAFQAAAPSSYLPWNPSLSFGSMELWEDGGISVGGNPSMGPGTLNFHGMYIDGDAVALPATTVSNALTSGHIFVGSAGGIATGVAMSGDVTNDNAGVTAIGANKVSNAKLAQMAAHSFKGNNTGSTADPIDLTATQLTAELVAFAGDTGGGGTKGVVPAPAAGDAAAGKYADAAGGWSVPPGTGSLPSIASGHLLANATAGSTAAGDTVLSDLLDRVFGSATGKVLTRGATVWEADTPAGGSTSLAGDSDVAITAPADHDLLAYDTASSKWTNRTAAAATALLSALVGDTGSGGTKGLVPAPAAGDAAAGKVLGAGGGWVVPATVTPAMVLIATLTAANTSPNLDHTTVGAYKAWRLIGTMLCPVSNGAIASLRFGTGGGPTYAATNYNYAFPTRDSAGSVGGSNSGSDTSFVLYNGGVSTTGGVCFDLTIVRDASTFAVVMGTGHTRFSGGSQQVTWNFTGEWTLSAAITAIRFLLSTGNINSGTLSLYGLNQ